VLSWDFENNKEFSMYQLKCKQSEWPENYVVKGLNISYNYFVSRFRVFCLESNMPLCESVNNSLKVKEKSRFNKQRKIYEDSSRYLSIDH
jgi:hypothetical protein